MAPLLRLGLKIQTTPSAVTQPVCLLGIIFSGFQRNCWRRLITLVNCSRHRLELALEVGGDVEDTYTYHCRTCIVLFQSRGAEGSLDNPLA